MRKINKILLIFVGVILICLFPSSTQAQSSDVDSHQDNLLGFESNNRSFSLLDPQRLKINHSYTFSYFSSGNTRGSFGIYTTTLNYKLSDPLSLTLSLNYLHQPLSVFQQDNLRIKDGILPNLQLYYKPSSNFSLWINILTYPSPYGLGNEYLWWGHQR
jgi:hypothetical protein